jgi:hypothetical protein
MAWPFWVISAKIIPDLINVLGVNGGLFYNQWVRFSNQRRTSLGDLST